MIYRGSILPIVDNTGIKKVKCIAIYKLKTFIGATLGDVILVSLQKIQGKIKFVKGDLLKALIIRNKKILKRESGTIVKINSTGLIILKKGDLPAGKRIYGPVLQEIRNQTKFSKILSIAPLIV
jgi:large subunit ribosomal protein L14